MRIYERDRDESLIVAWYFSLKSDPVEFSNLFMKPLRNLTHLLLWAERDVKVMFEEDADGIWACSWAEPYGSDAFFGSWIRKDKRGTFAAVAFIRRCYRLCFEHFNAIIGITKQPNLDKLHLALGYRFVGEFSTLFDGSPARVYELSKEAFYVGRRRKEQSVGIEFDLQSVRTDSSEVRKVGTADLPAVEQSDWRSDQNGRRELRDTPDKPKRRRRTRNLVAGNDGHAAGVGAGGSG